MDSGRNVPIYDADGRDGPVDGTISAPEEGDKVEANPNRPIDIKDLFGALGPVAIVDLDEVDEDSEAVWKKNRTPETHRTRCGGTCFSAPTKHANKNSNRFDGYLILTDGEASDPGPSKLKRGWVIIPGRELLFSPSKRDFVIGMKKGKELAA